MEVHKMERKFSGAGEEHTTLLIGSSFSAKNDVSPTSLITGRRSHSLGSSLHCHDVGRTPLLC